MEQTDKLTGTREDKNCNTNKNIKLLNFGCKVNLYDGQQILQQLQKFYKGNQKVYIINTCTVTEKSARDCQKEVRKLAKSNNEAKVIVTGCDATINPSKYMTGNNTFVFSNFQKNQILLAVNRESANNVKQLPESSKINNSEISLTKQHPPFITKSYRVNIEKEKLEKIYGRTRAFIKIEDGCDLFCSFCIIPYVRGLPVSKPINQILEEIHILLDNGYKEIVLSGTHLGCYGKDFKDGTNLTRLIEKFKIFSHYDFRFRLSSIEIKELDEELLLVLKNSKNFCQHFHIPLQSGSDKILNLMNRRYTTQYYLEKISEIKAYFNNPTFSTDIIIGFPMEDEDDFEQTKEKCKEIGFFKIHIFPYSDRYITKSTKLFPKCDVRIIHARHKELSIIEKENMKKCYTQYINTNSKVLVEQYRTDIGAYFGYTEKYLKTLIYSRQEGLHNKLLTINPVRVEDDYLIAFYPFHNV